MWKNENCHLFYKWLKDIYKTGGFISIIIQSVVQNGSMTPYYSHTWKMNIYPKHNIGNKRTSTCCNTCTQNIWQTLYSRHISKHKHHISLLLTLTKSTMTSIDAKEFSYKRKALRYKIMKHSSFIFTMFMARLS